MSQSRPTDSSNANGGNNTSSSAGDSVQQVVSTYAKYTYDRLQKLFATNDVARVTGQFGVTLPIVVTGTYFLDVLYTLKTTGTKHVFRPNILFPYFATNAKRLVDGYFATYKQAGFKNLAYAGSGSLHEKVKSNTPQSEEHVSPHGEVEMPLFQKLLMGAVASGVTATIDLASTNYFSNKRALAHLGVKPDLQGIASHIKFGLVGVPARFMNLYFGAAGYFVGPSLVSKPIDYMLPQSQYGALGQYFTTIITGWMAGLSGNGFHVVRNNQLKEMQGLKAPSMVTVIKQLYAKEGPKAFFRGGAISSANMIVAFSALNLGADVFNSLFPEVKKPAVDARSESRSTVKIEEITEEATQPKALPAPVKDTTPVPVAVEPKKDAATVSTESKKDAVPARRTFPFGARSTLFEPKTGLQQAPAAKVEAPKQTDEQKRVTP